LDQASDAIGSCARPCSVQVPPNQAAAAPIQDDQDPFTKLLQQVACIQLRLDHVGIAVCAGGDETGWAIAALEAGYSAVVVAYAMSLSNPLPKYLRAHPDARRRTLVLVQTSHDLLESADLRDCVKVTSERGHQKSLIVFRSLDADDNRTVEQQYQAMRQGPEHRSRFEFLVVTASSSNFNTPKPTSGASTKYQTVLILSHKGTSTSAEASPELAEVVAKVMRPRPGPAAAEYYVAFPPAAAPPRGAAEVAAHEAATIEALDGKVPAEIAKAAREGRVGDIPYVLELGPAYKGKRKWRGTLQYSSLPVLSWAHQYSTLGEAVLWAHGPEPSDAQKAERAAELKKRRVAPTRKEAAKQQLDAATAQWAQLNEAVDAKKKAALARHITSKYKYVRGLKDIDGKVVWLAEVKKDGKLMYVALLWCRRPAPRSHSHSRVGTAQSPKPTRERGRRSTGAGPRTAAAQHAAAQWCTPG